MAMEPSDLPGFFGPIIPGRWRGLSRLGSPNMLSVSFVSHGLLGEDVSASLRTDRQAKMLGEEFRGMRVPIPESLLD